MRGGRLAGNVPCNIDWVKDGLAHLIARLVAMAAQGTIGYVVGHLHLLQYDCALWWEQDINQGPSIL